MKTRISHISYHLPKNILTNRELASILKCQEKELDKKFGIISRHVRNEGEVGSDLAIAAIDNRILEQKSEFDFLIYCSESSDFVAPPTSVNIHRRLKFPNTCACFDLPLGCSGFIYSFGVASALISSGQANKILLLFAEIPTSVIHSEDYDLRAIFGDAGCAVIVERTDSEFQSKFQYGTDSEGLKFLSVLDSRTKSPINSNWLEKYKNERDFLAFGRMEMNGLEVFRFSIERVPTLFKQVLEKHDFTIEDIDLFVFHQASSLILRSLQKKLNIPKEKFFEYFENIGNTVSCSIPIALKEAENQGKLKEGDKVMLLAFGIGFAWGGTIIEWKKLD
ncbi:MAG: hypothetical protein RL264_2155 [Bacteroidota bacterium]